MNSKKIRTLELKFDVKNEDYIIWNNQIVMSSTETDYFNKLFKEINRSKIKTRNVLEIGFGLGVSARLIQKELNPKLHEIIEIDKGIYKDLLDFSIKNESIKPTLGDWRSLDLEGRSFDFIFYDSYDYSGAEGWGFDDTKDDYEVFKKILTPDGYVCHPHFGDGPVRDINRFETIVLGRLKVSPITMWDKTICEDAAIVLRKPIS